jgi:hypothetical protein
VHEFVVLAVEHLVIEISKPWIIIIKTEKVNKLILAFFATSLLFEIAKDW